MESNAPLSGSEGSVVKHAISLEMGNPAIIHPNRNVNDDDPLGSPQRLQEARMLA